MLPGMRRYRYLALIRAINVGGNSVVKMADLRHALEGTDFTDVTTYIQTGNVIFGSSDTDSGRLARKMEKRLEASLGFKSTVFVLSLDELRTAAARNPFAGSDERHEVCHLMFLSGTPDPERRRMLMGMQGEEYAFHVDGPVLYYAYPKASAGRRRNIDFEKVLGVRGTSRSRKVVDTLIGMLGGAEAAG